MFRFQTWARKANIRKAPQVNEKKKMALQLQSTVIFGATFHECKTPTWLQKGKQNFMMKASKPFHASPLTSNHAWKQTCSLLVKGALQQFLNTTRTHLRSTDNATINMQAKYYSAACSRDATILHERSLFLSHTRGFRGLLYSATVIGTIDRHDSPRTPAISQLFMIMCYTWVKACAQVNHPIFEQILEAMIVNVSCLSCHHSFVILGNICQMPTLKGYCKCTAKRKKFKKGTIRQGTAIGTVLTEGKRVEE